VVTHAKEAGRLKAEIAVERCISAGTCATTAPAIFTQNENDGIAVVLQDPIPVDAEADVERAADLCPVQAILLHRKATG
jgi:ferredoxin